jgi:shikimate dehydrogenase
MAAHPGLPFPAALLRPGLWVAEVVYRPLETELLRTARAAGCATLDGGGMAAFQAADAFRLFTGREPDTARMLADITELAGAAGARN